MIQLNTRLNVADNSGVTKIVCIQVLKQKNQKAWVIKGIVKGVSKSTRFKKSDVVFCEVVRTKQKRKGLRFSENACILLNANFKPAATRVFGPVFSDFAATK